MTDTKCVVPEQEGEQELTTVQIPRSHPRPGELEGPGMCVHEALHGAQTRSRLRITASGP